MNGYSYNNVFSQEEIKVWHHATDVIDALPTHTNLRCHELTRAVSMYLYSAKPQLLVIDGHFGLTEHSWLVFNSKNRHIILDVYAVGSLPMVQLIDAGSLAIREPMVRGYKEGKSRTDIDDESVQRLLISISRHHGIDASPRELVSDILEMNQREVTLDTMRLVRKER